MRFDRPFAELFRHSAGLGVLRYLIRHPKGEWTAREIARRANVTQASGLRALNSFVQLGLVNFKRLGTSHAYKLNERHALLPVARRILELEKGLTARLKERLLHHIVNSPAGKNVRSVILFGSVARGDEKRSSDIDVMVITRKSDGKTAVESEMLRLAGEIEREFGSAFSPVVYSPEDIRRMRRRRSGLVKAVEETGKVLMGDELEKVQ